MMRGSKPCIFAILIAVIGPVAAAEDVACGPRVARAVLQSYGRQPPMLRETILAMQGSELDRGASLLQMKEFMEQFGIHVTGVYCDAKDVPNWEEPVILLMNAKAARRGREHHYQVFISCNANGGAFTVWDALEGYRTLTRSEFQDSWTGHALVTSKNPVNLRWSFGQSSIARASRLLGYSLMVEVVIFIVVVGHITIKSWHRKPPTRNASFV
ncbi:MAG: Peptidase family protein [Schlesneria sp.]|nr:Peptidase family protein [Schlesneria sp.]